jgi:hypothetical protein
MTDRPDPEREIRVLARGVLPGSNYWSRGPVTRFHLAVGAYDEISSAEVAGFTDTLLAALPGLIEHRCSVGERGGFVQRLRRGTYAPHILEHIALELQDMIGHPVGFGRARGAGVPGEYTVVFEHRHTRVGLLAGELGLRVLRDVLAGREPDMPAVLARLEAAAREPDAPGVDRTVACAILGGRGERKAAASAVLDRSGNPGGAVIALDPVLLLEEGLPYARTRLAMLLGGEERELPSRFREEDALPRLRTVVAESITPGGFLVAPGGAVAIHRVAAEAGVRLATFPAAGSDAGTGDLRVRLEEGRAEIVDQEGRILRSCAADRCAPAATHAGALAAFILDTPRTGEER